MSAFTTITCPHCNTSFKPDEAFQHALAEEILHGQKEKQAAEIEKVRAETERKASEKLEKEYRQLLTDSQKDATEEKERNRELIKQLSDLSEQLRQLRRKDEERGLEMQKKLAEAEEKIREEAMKKSYEAHELKDKEKDKVIADLTRALEDAKRKAEQSSQQLQGEVLELALEEMLRREFPLDTVSEVKKGQRGADILQTVVDKTGKSCGTILWESKNAQWTEMWIPKLKEDQRQAKANLCVLAVVNGPDGLETFKHQHGVWICKTNMAKYLALALRYALVGIMHEKTIHEGKNEKMEVLYSYITSVEFVQRIESIRDAFGTLQEELEREKRWFTTKWARQEKELRKVIDHTHGLYGDLQGVVGKSLPEMPSLSDGPDITALPVSPGSIPANQPLLTDAIR